MGNNGNHKCPQCNNRLSPVKLYAPEILKIIPNGTREYSKNGILTEYSVCLNNLCHAGKKNIHSYESVVDEGMVRKE